MSAVASVSTPGVFVATTPRSRHAAIVVADGDVRDDLELGAGGVEELAVDAFREQAQDGVGAGHAAQELLGADRLRARPGVDLVLEAELLDGGIRNPPGDDDPAHAALIHSFRRPRPSRMSATSMPE